MHSIFGINAFRWGRSSPAVYVIAQSLSKVEKIQSAEKKLKAYKKVFHRDSVKFKRELKRYYKKYQDSLDAAVDSRRPQFQSTSDSMIIFTDSLGKTTVFPYRDQGRRSALRDSLLSRFPGNLTPSFSTPEFENELRPTTGELKDKLDERFGFSPPDLPGKDSLGGIATPENLIPKDLGFQNLPSPSDTASIKAALKKQAEDLAMKYVSENPASIDALQRKMSRLMRKYSVIPNSNDLSTAVKATSLAGRPFKERLYLSGNFQTPSLNPLAIDVSPVIGYRFTSRLISGLGATYRHSFGDSIPKVSSAVYGYKFFISYDLIRQFFAYGEFAQNSALMSSHEESPKRTWTPAGFVGVGRKFMIHPKVETTITAMYNLLYEKGDPVFTSPWAVRVGFQSSILGFRQ